MRPSKDARTEKELFSFCSRIFDVRWVIGDLVSQIAWIIDDFNLIGNFICFRMTEENRT